MGIIDRSRAATGAPPPRPFQRYSPPDIDAQSAISLKAARGAGQEHQLLFDKSSARRLPPASLTKLMTVVLMLELVQRFGKSLAGYLAVDETDVVGGSGLNIKPGEQITLRDTIANLVIPSSNITANAVARTFGQLLLDEEGNSGSDARGRFMDEMNARAAQLGMRHTQFRNPSGYPVRGQLTTAADMAKLMLMAMEYSEIMDSWRRPTYIMQVRGPKPRRQKISSTVKVINDYDVLGGKTGTLLPGYYNVAILSEAPNGDRIVTVILRAPDQMSLYTDLRRILDAIKRGRDWT